MLKRPRSRFDKKYHVTGFDIGYFKNCNLEPKKNQKL